MLIEPASNVSVPFTVVMRTRSNVPLKVIFPLVVIVPAPSVLAITPEAVQIFEPKVVKVKLPVKVKAVPEATLALRPTARSLALSPMIQNRLIQPAANEPNQNLAKMLMLQQSTQGTQP